MLCNSFIRIDLDQIIIKLLKNFIYKYVPNVLSQIPKQYQNLNRQSKEKYDEHHAKLIEELIACDDFEDIATLKV